MSLRNNNKRKVYKRQMIKGGMGKILNNLKLGLAGTLFALNSCSYITMKGFDKIHKNDMEKEELKITPFKFPIEWNKVKNISANTEGIIVFEYKLGKENSDIFMIKDEKTYQITRYEGYNGEPQIKGKKVVFTSDRNGHLNIFLADMGKEKLTQVTNDNRINYSPSIDDKATKIAYTSGLPERAEVYSIDLEKNESINISNDETGDYYSYISGDGNRVGFISERKGSSVYVKDIKTGELILVDSSYEMWYSDLRLNYNGTKVTYGGKLSTDQNGTIFFKDLETSVKHGWPLNKGYDGEPSIDSAGYYLSWISRQRGIYERAQKRQPLEDRVKKKIIKVVKTDKEGNIRGRKYVKLENKKAEPKIKVADTKTGYVEAIENQLIKNQMGSYISEISKDGKTIMVFNEENKENNYQIKNPIYNGNKYNIKKKRQSLMGD